VGLPVSPAFDFRPPPGLLAGVPPGVPSAVPRYERYPDVDQLAASSAALAREWPGVVGLSTLCRTRAGNEVHVLRIGGDGGGSDGGGGVGDGGGSGDGGRAALLLGFPHSNEAAGALALDWLAARLAADADLRRELGYTWYIIKCLDPDAARLNHGFFRRPDSMLGYALSYYRQPATEQPEWSFPVRYKTLVHDAPVPESVALAALIDRVRPRFFCALHNSNLGGAHFWLMEDAPLLYPVLGRLPAQAGLPLHLGEPQHALAHPCAPGVYHWTEIAMVYDYFAAYGDGGDPADLAAEGMSAEEYALQACGSFILVTEMPYFIPAGGFDVSPTEFSRRDLAREEIARAREHYAFFGGLVDEAAAHLAPAFLAAHAATMRRLEATLRARANCIEREAHYARPATVAEMLDRRYMHRVPEMLQVGMFLRVLEGRLRRAAGPARAGLEAVKSRALQRLASEHEQIAANVPYTATPIDKAVTLQVLCIAAGAQYAAWRG